MKQTIAALASLLLLTGCFEIEQSINLEKNLSGTADFHLGVNLEPMVVVMAQFAKEMEGKKGPLTKAELEKAKAEFRKSSKDKPGEPPSRKEIEKDLPPGVKLLDAKFSEQDFGVDSNLKFGFQKLQNLVGVKLPSKEGGDPTQKNVVDSPFEGLEVVEKGDTITISTKPQNPASSVKEEAAANAPKMDPEMEKMIRDAMKGLRVSYRITAPFTVVSHNATRKEGNTLIWEFDLEKFEQLEKAKKLDDLAVRVTYRR
jgi:hypothetical protein